MLDRILIMKDSALPKCKNILIIDDEDAIRESLKDVLELQGYNVTTAKDGKEGISTLSKMNQTPCMILLDLMMPGMNGWDFLDFQRSTPVYASIPVIICSAYEASARSIGTSPVILKPVKLNSLLDAVTAFCA